MQHPVLKVGILSSGKGSNLQSIIDNVEAGKIPAEIACIISDVENSHILKTRQKEWWR